MRKRTPSATAAVATNVAAPLPPADSPIVKNFDELARRGRDGDAPAAMRLFKDLQRCSSRQAHMAILSAVASGNRAVATADPERDHLTKRVLDQLDSTDALCAGVTAAQREQRGEWLRTAALDGDAEAAVCYATAPNDFAPKFLSDAWFDWTQRWRGEAAQFVAQAFAAGQADTIALLYDAYGNVQMPGGERYTSYSFGQLVAPDPALEYSYALLYERLVPQGSAQRIAHDRSIAAHARLSPAQVERAQAFADSLWPRFTAQAGERANVVPCREGLLMDNPFQ